MKPTDAIAEAGPRPFDELLRQANEHERAGRLDEADAALDLVLGGSPHFADALQLKGVIAFRRGYPDDAVRLIRQAISFGPAQPYYFRNLCEIYRILGQYDDALAAGRQSLVGNQEDAISYSNLSVLHYARGEAGAAIAAAERAVDLGPTLPSAHLGLAEALLISGEFARGWEEYEWRFRVQGAQTLMPELALPAWDGTPLRDGRLLLIADQGFGDVIQFCRYIPWAAARCAELVVACSREMQPIIGQFPAVKLMFDRWERCPDAVAYCPLSGLPRLHGTRLDTIPRDIPYLRSDRQKAAKWSLRLAGLCTPGSRRIGIAWAGRPSHGNDRNRSMMLRALAPLGDLDGITLVSLQKAEGRSQIADYFGQAPLVNLGAEIRDFDDTMAILDHLDLVVTVDTAIAHLAGAIGRPVWIMVASACDWRWLQDRNDTPWYPSARLFRQERPGEWAGVAASIAEEIGRR